MANYVKINYEERPCSICGVSFKPKSTRHKLCSPDCRAEVNKEYQANWYDINRDSELVKRKQYVAEWRKLHPGKTYMKCVTSLWNGAKDRASKSGLEFSITPLDLVIPDVCPILAVKMERPGRYAPSIDRIDSTKGYVPDNIWIISKLANRMKNDATKTEIKAFGKWANELTQ